MAGGSVGLLGSISSFEAFLCLKRLKIMSIYLGIERRMEQVGVIYPVAHAIIFLIGEGRLGL